MNRRQLMKTGLATAIAGTLNTPTEAAQTTNHFYELRTYELRNDFRPPRLYEFFQTHFMPFMKRAGAGPVGCFNVISGMQNPALIVLIDYPSLAGMQSVIEKTSTDKDFNSAWRAFETNEMPYVRHESMLLKAFDNHPKVEVPPTEEKRPPRIFELRTYESRNAFSLRDKIAMFNQEEIRIFRECGFAPVFFAEGLVAPRMPHLTYMVGFDNMAVRDKAWDTFRANPDWVRIRVKPGWTDAEVVSNSRISFLRPTAFSEIR